jgi:hypothetical protein
MQDRARSTVVLSNLGLWVLPRIFDDPVPVYTLFGSDSETSTASMEAAAKEPSGTLAQLCPASVVFQTPPPVDPM